MAAPRIVVLDGFTLNPGDLSWGPLAELGALEVHERSGPEQVRARAQGAPIVLTNKAVLDAATIEALPELRYVGVTATGTNIVDRGAAAARGVVVCNVPSYGADSVAEHTLCLMLEAVRHLSAHLAAARAGAWSRQRDFSFQVERIGLLAGKTLGVVGFGAIGRRVAELAAAFRMRVVVARSPRRAGPLPSGLIQAPLDALIAEADFVSLHVPLTTETAQLMNAERLARLRPSAVLINTARGGLIDEPALAEALRRGRIAGAFLDVLSSEPPPADHPLLALPTCHVTPHVAWASVEARQRLLDVSIDNVRAFMSGEPRNVVPPPTGAPD